MGGLRLGLERSGEVLTLRLSGPWQLEAQGAQGPTWRQELAAALAQDGLARVGFDSAALESWDSLLLAFVRDVRARCGERGVALDPRGLPAGARRLLALADAAPEQDRREPEERELLVERLGRWSTARWRGVLETLDFIGETTLGVGRLLTGRAQTRRRDFLLQVQESGAEALPIVTLISALIGLILGFVGAVQLRRFGAGIFVADLVAIGMLREMGPMMTAVLMAGRTGANFAAQLGTMRVSSEIDALVTFGMHPVDMLVLPRMLALQLMLPLLTLYANLIGILGGAVVGVAVLGLAPRLYYDQTLTAITTFDLFLGLIKGIVFGTLVAVAGCLRGLQARGSAAAVGRAATRAVVTGIVAIIAADGLFAVILDALGL